MRTWYAAAVIAVLTAAVAASWLTTSAPAGSSAPDGNIRVSDPTPAGAVRADAVVLVDSSSPDYGDFGRLIAPYLDHLGVPYHLVDVARGTPDAEAGAAERTEWVPPFTSEVDHVVSIATTPPPSTPVAAPPR